MKLLMTPGPTNVPRQVRKKEAEPMIHHRTKEFSELFFDVTEKLKKLFETKNDIYILTSSGTGAMEAAVSNLLSKGDKVLVLNAGFFGDRWKEICSAFGADIVSIDVEWGKNIDISKISQHINDVKAVFATFVETSTGAVEDIKAIGEIVEKSNAVFVVDSVAGIGTHEFKQDEWKVDIALTVSQKGMMCAPGLSFISASPKAWKLIETSSLPKYYFDLKIYRKHYAKGETPNTPAISVLRSLQVALDMIEKEDVGNFCKRHALIGEAVRKAVAALGLEILAESPSYVVTAVKCPPGINPDVLEELMYRKYDIRITGGQGNLHGKIFRIGHIGAVSKKDILKTISALEKSLKELGCDFEEGAGVKAAKNAFKGA